MQASPGLGLTQTIKGEGGAHRSGLPCQRERGGADAEALPAGGQLQSTHYVCLTLSGSKGKPKGRPPLFTTILTHARMVKNLSELFGHSPGSQRPLTGYGP